MTLQKLAFLSPGIEAQQAEPSPQDEEQLFEDKFGQMAYQTFTSMFPDVINNVVTFKILDSDIDAGTAVGAFVAEAEGEFLYIPAVLSDNQLKPFDMMYVKSKDIFLPLSAEWMEEIQKGALASLGQGADLPDTVATDVDIRNLIVPPTTGRYSYASYEVSPKSRIEAEATEPLGRKLANAMQPFPDPQSGQADTGFNPEVWATFVDQFQRINGSTPGQSLDNGVMDIDTMAKMYKSHMKTWEMAPAGGAPPQQQMAPPPAPDAMGMPPQPADPMGGAPKMASAAQQAIYSADDIARMMASVGREGAEQAAPAAKSLGQSFDDTVLNAARGSAIGGAIGGVDAASDRDLRDVPNSVLRGMVGGAAGATAMRPLGRALGRGYPQHVTQQQAATAGSLLGAGLGGFGMQQADPRTISQFTAPSAGAMQDYQMEGAPGMYRTASDQTTDIISMVKHAKATTEHSLKLPEFLSRAPNAVKTAYAKVLESNPRVLKAAADIYGERALVEALTHKEAGMVSSTGGGLYIADKNTKPRKYEESFGSKAPEAYQGVLMRGYYFKDTRPKLNLAVQTQEYHDFHDAKEPGIYRLYNKQGTPKTALVICEPIDLCSEDRDFYPKDSEKVKGGDDAWCCFNDDRTRRLAVFSNGDYIRCTKVMGEMVTEALLKGGPLYTRLMTDKKAAPSKGKGFFAYKTGSRYGGSLPVTIESVSTSSKGVIRGRLSSEGGFGAKDFVIDSRSPVSRPKRLKDQNLVIIPASWAWVPLNEKLKSDDYLNNAKAISDIVLDSLGSMGMGEAVARKAGQGMYAVNGSKTMDKKAALEKLAVDFHIHASAAEAMLKIAEHEGVSRALITTPAKVHTALHRVKVAQGEVAPQQMGGAPAMQQGAPPPQQPPAPPAMEPPAPSPVDMAVNEQMQGLQSQMQAMQQTLDVLMSVQQRAQQIEAEQGGMAPPAPPGGAPAPGAAPAGPGMQGMPPGMDPGMAQDPAAMQQGEEPPPPAVMRTETPSAQEIASQVNPEFLEQAGQLQEAGAFDAGSIASLSKAPSIKSLGSEYAAGLENSVDDLGRTLLTLYMQEPELKTQLGDESFTELETQLRDTFHALGDLVLSLTHNTAMLSDNAVI